MGGGEKVNILLVDDQPGKLLSYEVILGGLGETLIKANSAREALEYLLKTEIAVVLIDVVMPELNGFQLASMIREHPRFQKTSIIFISAIQVTDMDRLRGYEIGGVDYVPVPVIPEMLRAKVKVFVELFRKTRELEKLNRELERRVEERTAELQSSNLQLQQSEQRRTLALAAGNMGSWHWDLITDQCQWDEGQYRIFGLPPDAVLASDSMLAFTHPDDRDGLQKSLTDAVGFGKPTHSEFRVVRPDGEVRWCMGTAAATLDGEHRAVHLSGVTVDITDRKQAEERQLLLAREVDHRARNALAVVQSILRLSRADNTETFVTTVDGRIRALARAHTLLSESRWEGAHLLDIVEEELAPYRLDNANRAAFDGPNVVLRPATAQALALVLHELVTNAAKYGALSRSGGEVRLSWSMSPDNLVLEWGESGGPPLARPSSSGFGTSLITASIETGLTGTVAFDWRQEGLACVITVPRKNIAESPRLVPLATAAAASQERAEPIAAVSGARILIVEDEYIIGMMIQESLQRFGFEIVGPCTKLEQALSLAGNADIQAAVLDLNLAGTAVYPVADALAARGIPFVLVTGYDAETVEQRHSGAPLLQKPIEPQSLLQLLNKLVRHQSLADQRLAV